MKLYHGSTSIIEYPLVNIGRKHLDFGKGFYLTDLQEQAISWAHRPVNKGKAQYLNVYELDFEEIIKAGYRYLHFESYDNTWLEFVVDNRRGGEMWKEYDLIN